MVSPHDAIQPFRLAPKELTSGKKGTVVAKTDITVVEMQVAASGGSTNMHAHTGLDGAWFVVSGEARFYTADPDEAAVKDRDLTDIVVGDFGPCEGVLIRRDTPYWFECISKENLLLLHVATKAQAEPNKRVNYSDRGRPDLRLAPVEVEVEAEVAADD